MIEPLRRLRLEAEALIAALAGRPSAFVDDPHLLERVEQLFLAWSQNVRPPLASSGVPAAVLKPADGLLAAVVRLTGRRNRRSRYRRLLGRFRRSLQQVLLEAARIRPSEPAREVAAQGLLPEIPDITNELIPNPLLGWIAEMQKFMKRWNFERNVFLMFAYRESSRPVVAALKAELDELGLNTIVARDHAITDDLYNPIACLLCCNYGVAIFDRGDAKQVHNPNIVYELAVMQLLKRRCLILKHRSVKRMPSDFLHKLYEDYGTKDEAVERFKAWWTRISTP